MRFLYVSIHGHNRQSLNWLTIHRWGVVVDACADCKPLSNQGPIFVIILNILLLQSCISIYPMLVLHSYDSNSWIFIIISYKPWNPGRSLHFDSNWHFMDDRLRHNHYPSYQGCSQFSFYHHFLVNKLPRFRSDSWLLIFNLLIKIQSKGKSYYLTRN